VGISKIKANCFMLKAKLLQTISGNALNSLLGFLCLIIIQRTATPEITESYIRISNYALVLFPFIEFGISTYVASSKDLYSRTLKLQLALTVAALVLAGIVAQYIDLGYEILATCLGIYAARSASAKYQRNQAWIQFNLINLTQNVARFSAILLLLLFGAKEKYVYGVVLAGLTAGALVYGFSRNIKITYGDFSRVDWGFLNHYGIACVIAIAMRLDLMVVDYLLTEQDFVAYGLMFQISLVLPMFTNALMAVYLVNHIEAEKIVHPIKAALILAVVAIPLYKLVEALAKIVFSITEPEYITAGVLIMLSGLGGLYYTKYEALFYKNDARKVLGLKLAQATIIGVSYPLMILTDWRSVILPALCVFLSRFYAWGYIYGTHKPH
jgi:hypothetical protein